MDISESKRIRPGSAFERHPWELVRRAIVLKFLRRYHKNRGTILDFGSGDAFVSERVSREENVGLVYAVDQAYDAETVNMHESKGDKIKFYTGLQSLPAEGGNAEACLLLDVLEHCEDDKAVLSSLVQFDKLGKGALFIITVPAFNKLFSGHDKILGHHRRYNRKELLALCRAAGLLAERSGYFFSALLLVRLFQKVLEKIGVKKRWNTVERWRAPKVLAKLIYGILWMDFVWLDFLSRCGIHLPGLSTYCICRKPTS